MNLHEQLGALEVGVDQLIQAVVAPQAQNIPETPAASAAPEASVDQAEAVAAALAPPPASEDKPAQADISYMAPTAISPAPRCDALH